MLYEAESYHAISYGMISYHTISFISRMAVHVAEQPDHDKDHGLGDLNCGHPAWAFRSKIVNGFIQVFDQAHLRHILDSAF